MNPIARLEQLRAARKQIPSLPPANSPNSPNSLAMGERGKPRQLGELGELARESLETVAGEAERQDPRQLGELGELGERVPEIYPVDEQRWGVAPYSEISPFSFFMPGLRDQAVTLLAAHFKRQPVSVWQWIRQQATRYAAAARHWTPAVCETSAMVDCLLWQWEAVLNRKNGRFDQIGEAIRKLEGIEECARDLARRDEGKEKTTI